MNINYYNPYVREELMLYHHGVLGQRWGKKNGPPYPIAPGAHSASEKKAGWRKSLIGKISEHRRRKADRKSRDSDLSTKKDKNAETVNDVDTNNADTNNEATNVVDHEKRYQEVVSKASKIVDEHDVIGFEKMDQLFRSGNTKDKKRLEDAADLGIKALDRIGRDAADDINSITDSDRKWFMFEDQTVGLAQIADMVNRGKSKDQVKSALKAAYDVQYDFYDDPQLSQNQRESIFELQEAAVGENLNKKSFVDACYEVKAEQDKASNKQSRDSISASIDPYVDYKKARDNFDKLMVEGANKETLLKAEKKINEAFKKTEQFAPRAEALFKAGYSYEEISRKLNIPIDSVYWYVGYPGANSWKK